MKRYDIYARRRRRDEWTEWTKTDDAEKAKYFVRRIEALGYEAKVTDPVGREIDLTERESTE